MINQLEAYAETLHIDSPEDKNFPKSTLVTRPTGGFGFWLELPGEIDTRGLFGAAIAKGCL